MTSTVSRDKWSGERWRGRAFTRLGGSQRGPWERPSGAPVGAEEWPQETATLILATRDCHLTQQRDSADVIRSRAAKRDTVRDVSGQCHQEWKKAGEWSRVEMAEGRERGERRDTAHHRWVPGREPGSPRPPTQQGGRRLQQRSGVPSACDLGHSSPGLQKGTALSGVWGPHS